MADETKITADVSGAAPGAPSAPPAPTGTAPAAPPASAAPPAPPAPTQAPPPAAAPVKGDPVAMAAAAVVLKDAQDALSEMDKWIEGATKERALRLSKVESAQNSLDSLQSIQTNSDAIQAYLAQQRANLVARGEQILRVNAFQKEHGFKLADLFPKRSALDTAMARKNSRGTQRPKG